MKRPAADKASRTGDYEYDRPQPDTGSVASSGGKSPFPGVNSRPYFLVRYIPKGALLNWCGRLAKADLFRRLFRSLGNLLLEVFNAWDKAK